MNTFTLKTPLSSEPKVEKSKIRILIGQDKGKELDDRIGPIPTKISIIDEVDPIEWMNESYRAGSVGYKKDIIASYAGKTYKLIGAFPVEVPHSWKTNDITIVYDYLENT